MELGEEEDVPVSMVEVKDPNAKDSDPASSILNPQAA